MPRHSFYSAAAVILAVACLWSPLRAHPHTRPKYQLADQAAPVNRAKPPGAQDTCRLLIRLVDAETRIPLPGLLRMTLPGGAAINVPELYNRGEGLGADHASKAWHVVLGPIEIAVPQGQLTVEAFSGLETETARQMIDLAGQSDAEVTLPLLRFSHLAANHWHSGNTHLHLMKMTRKQADQYLQTIPRGDGLELLFVSHLRRVPDDVDYITNAYTKQDLARLGGADLQLGHGEEHRHNFGTHGEGYGHVMLLNIQNSIQPVSIGPGIMRMGTDGPPLREGIQRARQGGGTAIWCHNDFGLEDVPNWVSCMLDAQNIFDGGNQGDYAKTFYRYLNLGFRVPFSTGTDWFLYDFSRVYVRVEGELTSESWLAALAKGRSFITNGPLLELEVEGKEPGEVIELAEPAGLVVEGRAISRHDFGQLELVHNGQVVQATEARKSGNHFTAALQFGLKIQDPGWVALRVQSQAKNELDGPLFAHTSPIYVDVAGERTFEASAAAALVDDMQRAIEEIIRQARFADDAEQNSVLKIYRDAIVALREHMQNQP